jgi:uncharacterized Zn finger protein
MHGSGDITIQRRPCSVRSDCPQCNARLAVLRVIGGKAGCEYWTMRCTSCGGIHLDIVKPQTASQAAAHAAEPGA